MRELACIFCQRSRPLVKITKEHVFPRWIDEILTSEILGPDRTFERTIRPAVGEAQERTWRTEVIATIEAPVVCGSQQDGQNDGCNDGWMSELDAKAKAIISPMILGNSAVITPQEQLTIATWAAMKTMVYEYVWGADAPVVSPQQDRDYVYRERRPPENMQIRIAALESNGRPVLAPRRIYEMTPQAGVRTGPGGFAFCATFAYGCFVVQTFGGPALVRGETRRAPLPTGADYIPIYPANATSVTWPPAQVLDDAAFDLFAYPLQPLTG